MHTFDLGTSTRITAYYTYSFYFVSTIFC
uniref:Uncharacterized protein n=1 Tax=Rhizophora mucronata TaxID=61149 RepID=A0A2P2QG84_RHIMU